MKRRKLKTGECFAYFQGSELIHAVIYFGACSAWPVSGLEWHCTQRQWLPTGWSEGAFQMILEEDGYQYGLDAHKVIAYSFQPAHPKPLKDETQAIINRWKNRKGSN